MSQSDWREQLPRQVRVLQVIIGAMCLGCFFFMMIAIFAMSQNAKGPTEQPMLTNIVLILSAMALGPWIVVPKILVSQGRKNISREQLASLKPLNEHSTGEKLEIENIVVPPLLKLLQTKTIVASAMLEGTIFLLLVAYMVEHSYLAISAAVALLVLLICQVPSTRWAEKWLDEQMILIDEER